MTNSKDKYKKNEEDNEGSTESGRGGASGSIEFVDFTQNKMERREDLLMGDELRQLLTAHEQAHEVRVKKQKELRDDRQALKEGKKPAHMHGLLGSTAQSEYKTNPVLANKAQFSGVDRQVNALPTENLAETNQAKREELEYQYRLQNRPESAPKFAPRPEYR